MAVKNQRKDAIQYVYEKLDLGAFDETIWQQRTKKDFISDLTQWVCRFCRLLFQHILMQLI
jgi:hypothetical protein